MCILCMVSVQLLFHEAIISCSIKANNSFSIFIHYKFFWKILNFACFDLKAFAILRRHIKIIMVLLIACIKRHRPI